MLLRCTITGCCFTLITVVLPFSHSLNPYPATATGGVGTGVVWQYRNGLVWYSIVLYYSVVLILDPRKLQQE